MNINEQINITKRLHRTNIEQHQSMIAIIFKGRRILSVGRNNILRKSFSHKARNKYHADQGLHAELDAILKWKNRVKGTTLIVYGTTRCGNTLTSTKPCSHCLAAINAVNINKIVFIKNGRWIYEQV